MEADQIVVGHIYEAKSPRKKIFFLGSVWNDRQVLWVCPMGTTVQYDSPSTALGSRYPKVSMAKFLKWAGRDITDEMPKENWRNASGKDRP